jgi:hypothetical protein
LNSFRGLIINPKIKFPDVIQAQLDSAPSTQIEHFPLLTAELMTIDDIPIMVKGCQLYPEQAQLLGYQWDNEGQKLTYRVQDVRGKDGALIWRAEESLNGYCCFQPYDFRTLDMRVTATRQLIIDENHISEKALQHWLSDAVVWGVRPDEFFLTRFDHSGTFSRAYFDHLNPQIKI